MYARLMCGGIWLAALGFPGVATADELEAAEAKIVEAWSRLRTVSATMSMKSEIAIGESKQTTDETGPYELLRKGDKVLYRKDIKHVTAHNLTGTEEKAEFSKLWICDGDFEYEINDYAGQKHAAKRKANAELHDPKTWFAAEKTACDRKLLPDEKVEGHDCWVIEATRKSAKPRRTVSYYAKETGFKLKSVTFAPDGKQEELWSFTGVKFNEEIDPQRFVFNPEGYQVEEYP